MTTIETQLNIIINPDKLERLKNKVRDEGKTLDDVINELIDAYLADTHPDSLNNAIANHPTIQSMKSDIDKLGSYLDGLTRVIQDIKVEQLSSMNNE
ncbi:uroporphyrinogen decarboxylase/cobalamine-independent methonine synthase family protein [Crocosphaera chwakensis]|uniref:Uncharacterized protein n=1 Tax=Crocosphaera chwakensis CCY0110 TaxID=391612 RepID=A3IPZ0_9CHRO|nr:hypothetical protein [Crocosphaera chwakensis]EAZ91330.1 hypothetical protein CY0110_05152 [Crocosphaera chwakensis CCY0110]